jgi:hypothetical protein
MRTTSRRCRRCCRPSPTSATLSWSTRCEFRTAPLLRHFVTICSICRAGAVQLRTLLTWCAVVRCGAQ